MDEGRGHGRVHTPRERADDAAIADLGANALHRVGDERARRPRRLTAANTKQEVAQDLAAAWRVNDLGVELDAVDAVAIGESGEG